jgi:uncharacterized membrane protein
MRVKCATCIILVCLAFTIAYSFGDISVQAAFEVQSTNLTLYRDGLVHVLQEITVDATFPEITLRLTSDSPQNVLLLDENSTVVDYRIVGDNLTAYTLGANRLLVEYDTLQLTRKEAEIWTLIMDCPYNVTVFLPQNSTIVDLNQIPQSIETREATIALSLAAGNWEISYVLPAIPYVTPTGSPAGSEQATGIGIGYIILIIIIVCVVAAVGFVTLKKKGGPKIGRILKENPQLSREDQEVIQFLIQKEGRAFEAELRENFPNMPRTSLWRLVRRLERLDIVEIKKIGLENQVILKK